jgi:pre-rRNA-processing protein TSR1
MLLRQLANQKQRHLSFRDRRAYLFAHAADFVPSKENDLVGTLKISGYVRGKTMNVNSLLHIVGHGDFQMKQIDAPMDPFPLNTRVIKSQKDSSMTMEVRLMCFVASALPPFQCWGTKPGSSACLGMHCTTELQP